MAAERATPVPESEALPFSLEIKPKLTITSKEISDLAKKKYTTPRELIENIIQTRRTRLNPKVKAGDSYVVLSKDEDGIFVSSSHSNPIEAVKRASEATFNIHQIWKDGKYPAGSPQDMTEEKPPKYYAYDMEGRQITLEYPTPSDVPAKNKPMLERLKKLFINFVSQSELTIGKNARYSFTKVEDEEGFAFSASEVINLTTGGVYLRDFLIMNKVVSVHVRMIDNEGKLKRVSLERNNDAAVTQTSEFVHFLEIHRRKLIPKK